MLRGVTGTGTRRYRPAGDIRHEAVWNWTKGRHVERPNARDLAIEDTGRADPRSSAMRSNGWCMGGGHELALCATRDRLRDRPCWARPARKSGLPDGRTKQYLSRTSASGWPASDLTAPALRREGCGRDWAPQPMRPAKDLSESAGLVRDHQGPQPADAPP